MSYTFPGAPYSLENNPGPLLQWIKKRDIRPIDIFTLSAVIISGSFNLYQANANARQQSVSAAIEFSNRYLAEHIDAQSVADAYSIGAKSFDDLTRLRSDFAKLQYISYLYSKGRIDDTYLSPLIFCSIKFIVLNEKRLKGLIVLSDETRRFAREHDLRCPSDDPLGLLSSAQRDR